MRVITGDLTRTILLLLLAAGVPLACGPGRGQMQRDLTVAREDIDQLYQQNAQTQKALESRLAAFEARQSRESEMTRRVLTDLEQRVVELQEQMGAVRSQAEEMRHRSQQDQPRERVAINVGQGDAASTVVIEGSQLLLDAQNAMGRQDYAGARATLHEYLRQFQRSERAVDAYIWIGDTYYYEKDWANARAAYEVAARQFPKSPRAPEALMKVALTNENLGAVDEAVDALEQLLRAYPNWEQIERARDMYLRLRKNPPVAPPKPTQP